MSEPAMAGTGAGFSRNSREKLCKLSTAAGGATVWKHCTIQTPISVHAFCGQSGQGLAGLWQDMPP
jgi:hypothetical protein